MLSLKEYNQIPREWLSASGLGIFEVSRLILLEELLAAYIEREFTFDVVLSEVHKRCPMMPQQKGKRT